MRLAANRIGKPVFDLIASTFDFKPLIVGSLLRRGDPPIPEFIGVWADLFVFVTANFSPSPKLALEMDEVAAEYVIKQAKDPLTRGYICMLHWRLSQAKTEEILYYLTLNIEEINEREELVLICSCVSIQPARFARLTAAVIN